MVHQSPLQLILHRVSGAMRERGRALRKLSSTMGFVYFGTVDQHTDDFPTIRGFTASLSHHDAHFAVGTYDDYDIRMVDRFDVIAIPGVKQHRQFWTIIEITLESSDLPHVVFVPTGREGGEYAQLFATQPHLQPLNTMLGVHTHSPEFHGRYQILARPSHSAEVEQLFDSPTIANLGARFWPHGIEVHGNKAFIYLTQPRLNAQALEVTLTSTLWLAGVIDSTPLDKKE